MDRACCALVALVVWVGCGDDGGAPSSSGALDAEAPRNDWGHIDDGFGSGSEMLADAAATDVSVATDGGAAGSGVDQLDAGAAIVVDAATGSAGAASGGRGGAAGGSGAGGSGGSGGMPEPACSSSQPCLLASIEIPTATRTVVDGAFEGARARLGTSDSSQPLYLSTDPLVSEPSTFMFKVSDGDEAADGAAAYVEANGGWLGRATICSGGLSCWLVDPARLDGLEGVTITSFVAVIDPLQLEADGANTTATVGGRWEVWGYGP